MSFESAKVGVIAAGTCGFLMRGYGQVYFLLNTCKLAAVDFPNLSMRRCLRL